jgi:hypothetical protein
MLYGFRLAIILILVALGAGTLFAQSCPSSDGKDIDAPQASVLRGTIKFHPGPRPWIGLVLQKPACGTSEIQLAFSTGERWHRIKQMDRCSVTVKGVIIESPTAYYSADLNIFDGTATPDPECKLLPHDPNYSKLTIPDSIKSYEATIFTDIRGNKPLRGEVSSSRRRLEPWQAYVETLLNGEKDLNLSCGKGFELLSFKSMGSQSELFDPNTARLYVNEGAPASLTIVCRREK